MNLNRACHWPNCECKTEQNEPCKYEDPDFYINRAKRIAQKSYDLTYDEDTILTDALKKC